MNQFELTILDWIQANLRFPAGDVFFSAITHLADVGFCWIVLAAVLLCFRKTRKVGLAVAAGLVLDVLACNVLLKNLVARTRPFLENPAVELLIKAPSEFSFPSGHSAASAADTAALFRAKSKLAWPALVLSVILMYSRLYLYVHYPTDILGGAIVGALCGLLGASIVYRKKKEV